MRNVIIYPIKKLYYELNEIDAEKFCAIIVSSYDVNMEKVKKLNSKIVLRFDDITQLNSENSFNDELSEKIFNFVKALPQDIENIYVCCDAGESRSSGIAAVIMRFYGCDEMTIWKNPHYNPNTLVYKLLSHIFGFNVTGEDIRKKQKINEEALSDVINKNRN